MPKLEYSAIGRRKRAIARLRMRAGSGKIRINQREPEDYFNRETLKQDIRRPLEVCDHVKDLDIDINVDGGGLSGQAGAIRLAMSRALEEFDPKLRGKLKTAGLLTRDARVKERKKYGLAGARRGYQFSKR